MRNNELAEALYKYLNDDINSIYYCGEADEFCDFMKSDIKCAEAPDGYIVKDNQILIFEHFEFDCYKNNKKGSAARNEDARVARNFEECKPLGQQDFTLLQDKIDANSSLQYYLDNVISNFENHVKKIPRYIENLRLQGVLNEGMQVKVVFLIEDTSPLGAVVYNGVNMQGVVLSRYKQFLDFYQEHKEVNYILACSEVGNIRSCWLINYNSLDEYYKIIENYDDMTFIGFRPEVVGFAKLLSKK